MGLAIVLQYVEMTSMTSVDLWRSKLITWSDLKQILHQGYPGHKKDNAQQNHDLSDLNDLSWPLEVKIDYMVQFEGESLKGSKCKTIQILCDWAEILYVTSFKSYDTLWHDFIEVLKKNPNLKLFLFFNKNKTF